MEKCKILAVAPYSELLSMMEQVSKEFADVHLETFYGNLDNALNYANAFPGSSFHVILSRGGTALTLREKTTIPVVSVDVSTDDLLCTMKQVQQLCPDFAVVGYHNVVRTAKNICEILKWDNVKIVEINSSSADSEIIELKKEGISVLIGDVLSVETAAKYGIRGVLIVSSLDSIRKAFQEAVAIFSEMQRCQEQYFLATLAMEHMDTGVLLLNSDGEICLANGMLRSLGYEKACQEAVRISRVGENSVRTWRKLNHTKVEISMKKIQESEKTYFLFAFKNVSGISGNSCSIVVEDTFEVMHQLSTIFRGEEYVRPILESIHRYCDSHMPILLVGAKGLELSSIARYIHQCSTHRGEPFVRIRCDQLTPAQWEKFCTNTDFILAGNNCTLFFEEIHRLSDTMQQMLKTYLSDTDIIWKHYVIATGPASMSVPPKDAEFSLALYKMISNDILRVPSLSERPEELPLLINLCIPEVNSELSTNVIGVEPEALDILCGYSWPNNLEQLYLVTRRLVRETKGYYVTAETVRSVLSDYRDLGRKEKFTLNLNQSLEEMEREIIRHVFEEEGMNRNATVDRLGISRSTLWRKLNK